MSKYRKFPEKRYKKNWQISAPKVRLIDNTGKQVGIVTLQEAINTAQEKNLDLVEIAPRAKPPVVKIIDYAKFKYQQNKKDREERKKNKKGDKLKEIRLTPFIGEADLKNRIERAKEFSEEGDRLKFVIKFRGRQITQKQFGYKLLDRVKENLADFYEPESEPRLMGKRLILQMKPIKLKASKNEKES